jgi:uncharacterized membrane protein YeaQ/YmgE (transglycosylase-associated protein family)
MELSAATQAWVHLILVWVGFGAVVGFLANFFLPVGGSPGFFGNLVIGITGSCVGPVTFVIFVKPQQFHPMSLMGFAVAVFASILLLILYRGILFCAGVPKKCTEIPKTKETATNQVSTSQVATKYTK